MSSVLVIAERCEIGVICRPVERVADRGGGAQHEQRGADAVHLGEQRILQAGRDRADDHQRPQPPTAGEQQHARADEEAAADRKLTSIAEGNVNQAATKMAAK